MFNLLSIFGSIKEFVILLIVLAVVITIMTILFKFKNGKWVILGFMALALLTCGIFSAYANYEYFTIQGGTIGSFDDIFKNKNKLMQDNLKFNFENFVLIATGNSENEFAARIAIDAVNQKMINKAMFVNDNPTETVSRGDNYIFSEYNYTFYDENLKEKCSDTLTIKFVFNSKSSECIISTQGGIDKVSHWNYFLKKNNFVVEIKDEEYIRDKSVNIENSNQKAIRYYLNNELYKVETFNIGVEKSLLTKQDVMADKESGQNETDFMFFGWFLENPQDKGDLKKLTPTTSILSDNTDDITLYGKFFKTRAQNIDGYSDAEITLDVTFSDDLTITNGGTILVEFFDEDLNYTRNYTIVLAPGKTVLSGLKYADFKISVKPNITVTVPEKLKDGITIKTSYKSSVTLSFSVVASDIDPGSYSITTI